MATNIFGKEGETTLRALTPAYRLREVDQTQPAGQWETDVISDVYQIRRATASDWSTFSDCVTVDSSGNVTILGNLTVTGDIAIKFDPTPTDESYSGISATFTAAESLVIGDVTYLDSSSEMAKAVGTASGTMPARAICTATIAASGSGVFLIQGFMQSTAKFGSFTPGATLYAPEGSGGIPTATAPSTSGDFVQTIGYAYDANTVYFSADGTLIEIS